MREHTLFRPEAKATLENTVSVALADRRLHGPPGLVPLFLASVALAAAMMFVRVSVGVSAQGVVRAASGFAPVIAEQGGLLTDVIAEREVMTVERGSPIATIRNLDLVALRRAPNVAFTKSELERKRERLEKRLREMESVFQAKSRQLDELASSLRQLSAKIRPLIPVHTEEVARLEKQSAEDSDLLSKGVIRREQAETVRERLVERQLELSEAEIRLADFGRQLIEVESQKTKLEDEHSAAVLEFRNSISEIDLSLKAEGEIEVSKVTMPYTGALVPRGYSAGQVVKAGDVLFDIAPDSDVYVFEADLPAVSIGEVREGAPVKVAFTAYPYFKYGFVDGRVKLLSRVPNEKIEFSRDLPGTPRFRIVVEPDSQVYLAFTRDKKIVPGMTVDLHIKKESVAFWRLLFAPLLRLSSRVAV